MESKKTGGPRVATVAGSAAILCVLLVAVAYFLHDDGYGAGDLQSSSSAPEAASASAAESRAASPLRPLLDRCKEAPHEDLGEGRTRTRCTATTHPAFMMEVIGEGAEVERASLLVPMGGTMEQVLERTELGLELFSLLAGAKAEVFLPRDYLDAMGTTETRFVFQGRLYISQPVPDAGLVFAVLPEAADSAAEN